MKIEYYAFALFIAGLLCLIAILCKVLFGNVKRQYKLLDEKETKLLQLYQTVESIIDEFNDQVKATTEELREHERRIAALVKSAALPPPEPVKKEVLEKLPRAERVNTSRLRAANEALARAERIIKSDAQKSEAIKSSAAPEKSHNGAVFQRFFDESAAEQQHAVSDTTGAQSKSEMILALAGEGKSDSEIASQLGITQTEVKLTIGLTMR